MPTTSAPIVGWSFLSSRRVAAIVCVSGAMGYPSRFMMTCPAKSSIRLPAALVQRGGGLLDEGIIIDLIEPRQRAAPELQHRAAELEIELALLRRRLGFLQHRRRRVVER